MTELDFYKSWAIRGYAARMRKNALDPEIWKEIASLLEKMYQDTLNHKYGAKAPDVNN